MQRGRGEGCCMEGPSSSVVPCVVVVAAATAHSTTKFHLSFRLSNFCDKIMLCLCWKASRHSEIQQQTRQGCHTHFTVLAFRGVAEDTIASRLLTTNKILPARTTLSLPLSLSLAGHARLRPILLFIPQNPSCNLTLSILDSRFRRLFTRTPSIALSGFPRSRPLLTTKFFPLSRDP
jgi:hypothetical protein